MMGFLKDLVKLAVNYRSFRLVKSFSDNLISYVFPRKKRFFGPSYISWNVTEKCNLNCSFCSYGYDKRKGNDELTFDEGKKLLNQASKLGVYGFCFTGGEPFARKDIFDLIKYAKQKGLFVNLNSNGAYLEKHSERILKSGLDSLTVSIDSLNPKVHDSMRGVSGCYNKILKGIERLKRSRKKNGIKLGVRLVISKENQEEIFAFYKNWKERVDFVRFQPMFNSIIEDSNFKVNESAKKNLEVNPDIVKEQFDKIFKFDSSFDSLYNRGIVKYYTNLEQLKKSNVCCAGNITLKVSAKGDVFMCSQMFGKVGNILQDSLYDIWTSKIIEKRRMFLKRSRNRCFCWTNDYIPILYFDRISRFFCKK